MGQMDCSILFLKNSLVLLLDMYKDLSVSLKINNES
jgi:hypothetical protein